MKYEDVKIGRKYYVRVNTIYFNYNEKLYDENSIQTLKCTNKTLTELVMETKKGKVFEVDVRAIVSEVPRKWWQFWK
jgi:hypothetical protein